MLDFLKQQVAASNKASTSEYDPFGGEAFPEWSSEAPVPHSSLWAKLPWPPGEEYEWEARYRSSWEPPEFFDDGSMLDSVSRLDFLLSETHTELERLNSTYETMCDKGFSDPGSVDWCAQAEVQDKFRRARWRLAHAYRIEFQGKTV